MSSEPLPEPRTIDEIEVYTHLDLLLCGADMCARHTARLAARLPQWRPGLDDLKHCELVLDAALGKIREALATFGQPPEARP